MPKQNNRVIAREGARELKPEEFAVVNGSGAGALTHFITGNGRDEVFDS